MRRHIIAALLCGLVAIGGCNSGPSETLHAVNGKLTVNGKAVPTGNVTFYPDSEKGNKTLHQPNGTIEAEGRYELIVPGGRKGAPPGWYKVVVYSVDDPQPMKPNKYFVHADYASVDTTPLKIEVVAEPEAGRYDWKLKK